MSAHPWPLVIFLTLGAIVAIPVMWRASAMKSPLLAISFVVFAIIIINSRLILGEWPVFEASMVGGGIGVWLANRRARAMEDNVRLTRFKDAVGMLGGSKSSVLVGAVYALHEIAKEEKDLRVSVFAVLCEFVRKVGEEGVAREIALVARQTALKFLFDAHGTEVYGDLKARLAEANFAGLDLSGMNFTGTDFTEADFGEIIIRDAAIFAGAQMNGIKLVSGQDMHGSDFTGADMRDTNFFYVHFEGCDFAGAKFRGTSFDGSFFFDAENLTYEQLKSAKSLRDVQGLPEDLEKRLRRDKPELFGESPQ